MIDVHDLKKRLKKSLNESLQSSSGLAFNSAEIAVFSTGLTKVIMKELIPTIEREIQNQIDAHESNRHN